MSHAAFSPDAADEVHGHAEHETNTRVPNRKLAFWVFLSSEAIFFGSLIATYLSYTGRSVNGPYPLDVFDIPLTSVSTFVLLMSSLTMVLAVNAAQQGNRGGTRRWLAATAGLGMVFLGFQAYEFTSFVHEGLRLSTNLFGSTFYTLTGFHGAHVAVGVAWLLALLIRAFRVEPGPDHGEVVEVAGLYWHFVDVVWIVIFTLVYLMELGR